MKWIVGLVVLMCLALAQEQQLSDSSYLTISWSQVSHLIATASDPYFSWLRYCSDPESQWLDFALRSWSPSTLQSFLDFSPGIGRTFIPLALHSQGISILFVGNEGPLKELLFHNLKTKNLVGKVVISLVHPFSDNITPEHYMSAFEVARNSLSLQCANLVHLQYLYLSQLTDVVLFMENRASIIAECRSSIYFDTNSTHILRAVSQYLFGFNYSLEYSELCSNCGEPTVQKNIRWMLFATPKANYLTNRKDSSLSGRNLEDIVPSMPPSPKHLSSSFDKLYRQSLLMNQSPECDRFQDTGPVDSFRIRIPLSILTPSTSMLRCFAGILFDENMDEKQELFISQESAVNSHLERKVYLKWRCLAWVHSTYQQVDYATYYMLRSNLNDQIQSMQCIEESEGFQEASAKSWSMLSIAEKRRKIMSAIDLEINEVTKNCESFATHHYDYLQRAYDRKYHRESGSSLYPNLNATNQFMHHYDVSAETVIPQWFDIENSGAVERVESNESDNNDYDYDDDVYEESSPRESDQKINLPKSSKQLRTPLQILWEPDVCDDPIYCRMTFEFQRRLFVWQNPDHRHLVERRYSSFDYSIIRRNDDDVEAPIPSAATLWSSRTCSNAKFLIYEPFSMHNGLGSMWEQIAGAMRYAICHERILILNPLANQAGSLLKWRIPGCRGSVWECYFQPLSLCPLSHADYELAVTVADSTNLDDESVREHRLLHLKGFPNSGKCSMCHSDWPADNSTFFQGLQMADLLLMTRRQREEYVYFRSFGTNFRHVPSMQFIRYLMRPQQWLGDMLPQLVSYTMVSPITEKGNAASFSANFVSLHIRLGMKLVEETLPSLQRFMSVLRRKYPAIQDVFVSTETPSAIFNLTMLYPNYRFHHLHYTRNEYLYLKYSLPRHESSWNRPPINDDDDPRGEIHDRLARVCQGITPYSEIKPPGMSDNDFLNCIYVASLQMYTNQQIYSAFLNEAMMSLVNLYVASEAQGWVGTWTSNWCSVIAKLSRTRGDGGGEYHGVDRGSFYTSCF